MSSDDVRTLLDALASTDPEPDTDPGGIPGAVHGPGTAVPWYLQDEPVRVNNRYLPPVT